MKKVKVLGFILIALGVIAILTAVIMRAYVKDKADEIVAVYEDYINTTDNSTDNVVIDDDNTKTSPIAIPEGLIGILEIDKIDLSVTIAEGTANKDIMYSVGHFKNTAMPGQEGNFAVVGHRSYTYGQYFNRLDELEVNDEIIIRDRENVYTYVVDSKKVVEPSEVSVLEPTEGEKRITLVTCTPITTATHRLIVSGYLKE